MQSLCKKTIALLLLDSFCLFLCSVAHGRRVDYFEGPEGDEQQQPEATVGQLSLRELMHSECRTSHRMQMFICHASFSLAVSACLCTCVSVCARVPSWSSPLTCEIMRGHLSQMLCSKARDLPQQIAGSRRNDKRLTFTATQIQIPRSPPSSPGYSFIHRAHEPVRGWLRSSGGNPWACLFNGDKSSTQTLCVCVC